jgi:PAS domain S-box-containing protein
MKLDKDSASVRLKLIGVALLLVCVAVSLLPLVGRAQQSNAPKRILVLYWYGRDYPGHVTFDQGFQSALQSVPAGSVEYYSEYLDTKRFPGKNQSELLHDYLRQKYADRTIDVVVAVSDVAMEFLLRHRDTLFKNAPMVFAAIRRPTKDELAAGPGLTGVTHVDTHRQTLDVAMRLHRGTEHVFVISGTLERDKRFETRAREELQGYESRVGITYLTDLPPNELIAKVKSLPQRSIVLYAWQQAQDEQGKVLESIDVLGLIARSSPVPIYGMSSPNLGSGIVGGYLYIAEARGSRVAEMALRIVNGERAQDIPVERAPAVPMFDWRQLKRWGIDEDNLPPGSIVRFKDPTFWDQYKWHMIAALALIGAQSLLIAFLLLEQSKRRHATQQLRKSEEHFRLLFENSRDAILIADDAGHFLQLNQAACELLGYSREELLEMKVFDLVAADPPDASARYQASLQAGSGEGEFSFVRRDGESRTSLYSACRFAPGRHLSILRDITERNRADLSLRQAFSEIKNLKEQLQAENLYLKEEIKFQHNFDEIIGGSAELKHVLYKVEQVAPTDTTVLLLGETGTGKELIARAIHRSSPRHDHPLVKVNCAVLPAALIESELFGYEKGAFTGASARKIGRFELANEGTLLLDEIGDLPLELQAKLLRVLQEGEFERLGGSKTIKVNVRVIAATNQNLKVDVKNGQFREDLWYRLSVFPISLPSLRQRKDDIPLLVNHFSNIFSKKLGKSLQTVAPGAMKALQDYSWPGNVRELANVIERAVINAEGPVLFLADKLEAAQPQTTFSSNGKSLVEIEREIILQRLESTDWRVEGPKGAAHSLGLNPSTLRSRMAKLGIQIRKDHL